jgi:Protein of unknown function (DUF3295)
MDDKSEDKAPGSPEARKHLSPIDLENIVKSVTENSELPAELPPLPPSLVPSDVEVEAFPLLISTDQVDALPVHITLPTPVQSTQDASNEAKVPTSLLHSLTLEPESSTSTFDTIAVGSECSQSSNPNLVGSASTEVTSTSIVRGFSKDQISRSRRSTSNLTAPQINPILKSTPRVSPHKGLLIGQPSRKKIVFTIGSSEGEDSSADTRYAPRSVEQSSAGIQQSRLRDNLKIDMPEDVFDSDSEEENDDEWEDDNEVNEALPVVDEDASELFQRVSSSTQLSSRRSLITSMMHQKDRADAMMHAAQQSSAPQLQPPQIRRSRSHVAGPMISEDHIEPIRARAIAMPPSSATTDPIPLMSPRTNRRNMLSTELTGSLRKHLLWERQQRNPASKLLKNRQFRSETRLAEAGRDDAAAQFLRNQGGAQTGESSRAPLTQSERAAALVRNESTFYDNGALEYYDKGW